MQKPKLFAFYTQVSRDPYSWKNLGSYDVICGLCCRLRLPLSALEDGKQMTRTITTIATVGQMTSFSPSHNAMYCMHEEISHAKKFLTHRSASLKEQINTINTESVQHNIYIAYTNTTLHLHMQTSHKHLDYRTYITWLHAHMHIIEYGNIPPAFSKAICSSCTLSWYQFRNICVVIFREKSSHLIYRVLQKVPSKAPGNQVRGKKLH
jgi:hypothetical protein